MIGPPPAGLASQILLTLLPLFSPCAMYAAHRLSDSRLSLVKRPEKKPLEHVRPFLRDEVRIDRRPLELGGLRVGLEGDLLRHGVVQVVAVLQAARAAAVDDRHAVDHDKTVAGAAAVNDQVHAGFRNRAADVLPHAGDQHCRRQRREADEVPIGRNRVHHLARRGALGHHVLHVDDRAFAGDRDGFLNRAHLQLGVDVRRERGGQLDSFTLDGRTRSA